METVAVILGAGQGKRMHSDLPKVAHKIANKPLVAHVIDTAAEAGCDRMIVVVGNGAEIVMDCAKATDKQVEFAMQTERLGTGHAVMQVAPLLKGFEGSVLVLAGDVPLLRAQTLKNLVAAQQEAGAAMSLLSMCPPDATGYGRIVRNADGAVTAIVEHKDCTPEQLEIKECNAGTYCFDAALLLSHLEKIGNNNAQGEYYLTDLVDIFISEGLTVTGFVAEDYTETVGINSQEQLKEAEALYYARQ